MALVWIDPSLNLSNWSEQIALGCLHKQRWPLFFVIIFHSPAGGILVFHIFAWVSNSQKIGGFNFRPKMEKVVQICGWNPGYDSIGARGDV